MLFFVEGEIVKMVNFGDVNYSPFYDLLYFEIGGLVGDGC